MVELQAKVPCMRNHPATKQTPTSRATLSVSAQTTLAAISTAATASSWVRVEKRNLMRNMTAKLSAMPAREAYPAMRTSWVISA